MKKKIFFDKIRYMFSDRKEAGILLSKKLSHYKNKDVIVLAIPRGGVVVGAQISSYLDCSLDIIIPRKIGAPENQEYALGAITSDGTIVLNPSVSSSILKDEKFKKQCEAEIKEIKRREKEYQQGGEKYDIKDKIVILCDDGIATGSTMLAAIKSVEKRHPKKIVVAVPVLPRDTLLNLQRKVDEVVYLDAPDIFYAVGQFYYDFSQTTDEEVKNILKERKNAKRNNI